MQKLLGHGARIALFIGCLALVHCGGKAAEQGSSARSGSVPGGESGSAGVASSGGAAGSTAPLHAIGSGGQPTGSGGQPTGSGGQPTGSGGQPVIGGAGGVCGEAKSKPKSRPTAAACAQSPAVAGADAGVVSCSQDSDCASSFGYCRQGVCSVDQCLSDADCPSDQACRCAIDQYGLAPYANSCVPAACHTDADCGTNGACSATYAGRCGSLSGYNCHSPADTCNSDSDCCGDTPACQYQPALGHFACTAVIPCNG